MAYINGHKILFSTHLHTTSGGGGVDPSDADAIASNVLSGKTFYSGDATKKIGTIETYDGASEVTENGTLSTANKYMPSDIVVNVSSGGGCTIADGEVSYTTDSTTLTINGIASAPQYLNVSLSKHSASYDNYVIPTNSIYLTSLSYKQGAVKEVCVAYTRANQIKESARTTTSTYYVYDSVAQTVTITVGEADGEKFRALAPYYYVVAY